METSTNNKTENDEEKKSDDFSMNEELKEWLQQEKKDIEEFKKSDQYKEKEDTPKGMCEICGDNTAKFNCFKCGQKVCPTCFFNILGVCKKCVPKNIAEKWDGTNPDWEKVLGVEWVD
jgi:hypothetical protein